MEYSLKQAPEQSGEVFGAILLRPPPFFQKKNVPPVGATTGSVYIKILRVAPMEFKEQTAFEQLVNERFYNRLIVGGMFELFSRGVIT
jgi:hypothetical protein